MMVKDVSSYSACEHKWERIALQKRNDREKTLAKFADWRIRRQVCHTGFDTKQKQIQINLLLLPQTAKLNQVCLPATEISTCLLRYRPANTASEWD